MNTATYIKASTARISNASGNLPTGSSWEFKSNAWLPLQYAIDNLAGYDTQTLSPPSPTFLMVDYASELGGAVINDTVAWSSSSLTGQTLAEGVNTFTGVIFEQAGATENQFTATIEIRTTTVTCYLPPTELMKKSRIPAEDAKLLQWGLAWTKVVAKDSDINQTWLDFATAYQATRNPSTRTPANIAALETARNNFREACYREICPDGVGGSELPKAIKTKAPENANKVPNSPSPKVNTRQTGLLDLGNPGKPPTSRRRWLAVDIRDSESGEVLAILRTTKKPYQWHYGASKGKTVEIKWRWQGKENGVTWQSPWSPEAVITLP